MDWVEGTICLWKQEMGRAAKVQSVSFWDENSVLQVTANLSPLTAKKVAVNFDYFKIGGLVRTTSWLSMLFIMLSLVLKSTLWHMISYVPQQFEELTWSANSWRCCITNSQTHCSTTCHITDASTSWCCLQWAIVLCSAAGFCQRVPMWFAGNFLFLMKRRYFLTKGFRFCLEMWTIYTDSVDFYLLDICLCFWIHRGYSPNLRDFWCMRTLIVGFWIVGLESYNWVFGLFLQISVKMPDRARGELEITYLDDEVRWVFSQSKHPFSGLLNTNLKVPISIFQPIILEAPLCKLMQLWPKASRLRDLEI